MLFIGCISSAPVRTLSTVSLAPEKDVLHLRIALEKEVSAEQYHQLAIEKCRSLGPHAHHPHYPRYLLYKLIVSFQVGTNEVSQVTFKLNQQDSTANGSLQHLSTLVYKINLDAIPQKAPFRSDSRSEKKQ